MKYFEYENAFSQARLNRYLKACGGNTSKALTLYRHNVKLCQKFYGILNIFEVVLRNAINNHYKTVFNDDDWIEHQLSEGGMLENAPQKLEVTKIIGTMRRNGQNLLRVFPNRTTGLGQRAIFNELMEIKNFRNRIAHHEAICFNSNGNIDMTATKSRYSLILKYINFLGYQSSHLFWGIDVFPDSIIAKVEALK